MSKNSFKDFEAIIDKYFRKSNVAGNIDEFITACQNLKSFIFDANNKGRVITSKDLFGGKKLSKTLKESLPSNSKLEQNVHNLNEKIANNIRIESLDNVNNIVKNKPNQACCTRTDEKTNFK